MIISFYMLLVWLSPANFAWLWLLIAILMEWISFTTRAHREYMLYTNKNYWKGDKQ